VHRIRNKRKRIAAFVLLPFAALTASNAVAITAPPSPTATTAAVSGVELKLGKRHTLAGNKIKVHGHVAPGGSRKVEIAVDGKRKKTLKTKPDGTFRGKVTTGDPGVYKVHAVVRQENKPTVRSKNRELNVYRSVQASYYGPGLYGNGVACGGTLTPSTMGVANKTLPCGSKVTLRHKGKTITVPVIDRGPYSGNRVYDLTSATKNKLGYVGIGPILATK
jgi:rare lipoprotein A (peptidoglycan hydrolase)